MVRKMLWAVIAIAVIGLLGAGFAAATGPPNGPGASPASNATNSDAQAQKPLPQAAQPGVAEPQAAEQQA